MKIQTVNPATEEIIQDYLILNHDQIHAKIDAGYLAYQSWKRSEFKRRKKLMNQLAQLLKDQKRELGRLITREMGKPISSSVSEIEKCAWVCEHYAEHAEHYLESKVIETEWKISKVCYQPQGLIFAIMPWNYPFWQVFRYAAPTIMAGNGALLKHAPISSGSGDKIAELFLEAGFPEHLFQHLILDNEGAAKVIENEKVMAVTLTGSASAGEAVASNAGKHLKKTVLELGGCDPYLIFEDADLDLAAKAIVTYRLSNSGQSCISPKRILAVKSIADDLIEKIEGLMKDYQTDDPLKEDTEMGPMARKDLRQELHHQVQKSVAAGAKLRCGGEIPNKKGFYYPPTLLTQVKPGMPAFDEELFGPVISVITVEDEAEAIRYANKSPFGLGGGIFSQDLKTAEKIALENIESGTVFVNSCVISDPRLPFGGIKHSGYGRELSREGILEFVNTKTIVVTE